MPPSNPPTPIQEEPGEVWGVWRNEGQHSSWLLLLAYAIENTALRGPVSRLGRCRWEVKKLPSGTWTLFRCDCSRQDEVSTDKVRPLIDGQSGKLDVRMDGGQSGNLMQTKKMKDREELPTKAFRQYKSQSNLLTANWAQECVHRRVLPLTTGWLSGAW